MYYFIFSYNEEGSETGEVVVSVYFLVSSNKELLDKYFLL